MKNYSINQKSINLIILILSSLILCSIIYGVIYIRICIKNEQQEEEIRYEYDKVSQTLVSTSDYMTEAVRNFVVTKDFKYLDNYWEEVEIDKNREKVMEKLGKMRLSDREKGIVSLAKQYSDYLADSAELRATKLTIETLDIEGKDLPSSVKNYKLNTVDENLSKELKQEKAIELLFDKEYLQGKAVISDSIKSFQEVINNRLNSQINISKDSTMNALNIQTGLLLLSFILVIIVLIIFYSSFMLPIKSYTDVLNEHYSKNKEYTLKPKGSAELNLLAKRFNHLYGDLVKANNVKSEFLATMSHEIRTPLNTIMGYQQFLMNTKLDNQQKKAVYVSNLAAKSLLDIINNILDTSKLESHKFFLENTVFDLHEYLQNLREIFLNDIRKSGLYFNLNIDNNVPQFVLSDITKLNQILINIISNGIKFISEGGISMSVSAMNVKLGAMKVQFNIKDTGIGILEENIKSIFEPFEQLDASVTRKYGGTGLGLSISKKLSKLFDGDITVNSVYGEGSTFSVIVNLQEVKDPGVKRNISNEKTTEEIVNFQGVTLLLVDDNEINRVMEKELLKYYGFKVYCAQSGKKAIEMCDNMYFQIILMDIRMANIDGYEATEIIRSSGMCQNSYIIALTADGLNNTVESTKKVGMDDFFTKPLIINDVISRLKEKFDYEEVNRSEKDLEIENLNRINIEAEEKELFSHRYNYINIESALNNLNNNINLYYDLLRRFIKNYKNEMYIVQENLIRKNYSQVDEKLHVLKGVSGSIGALQLEKKIIKFREDLQNADYYIVRKEYEEVLNCYRNTLDEMVEIINISANQTIQKNEKVIKSDTLENDVLESLINCLEESNIDAIDIFNENKEEIKENLGDIIFEKFNNAIETYDMEEALVIIRSR